MSGAGTPLEIPVSITGRTSARTVCKSPGGENSRFSRSTAMPADVAAAEHQALDAVDRLVGDVAAHRY